MGAWLHGGAVAGFAGLFGLVVCRTAGVDAVAPALVVAAVVGVGVALAEWRVRWARQFLSYLAVGNIAFVVLFLVTSPSAELLKGVSFADAGNVRVPPMDGPVVVVVLDEFPLTSLLRADGSINEVRYPEFAALARESTWFRNAASESEYTSVSVPTILTGIVGDEEEVPFLRDHPRNLFTLFGAGHPVNAYEVLTDLCPPDVCARAPGQSLRQALDDASVVYRHRVLPEALRAGLPDIDSSWGNFGDGIVGDVPAPETTVPTNAAGQVDKAARLRSIARTSDGGRDGQARALVRQIDLIGAGPSINVIHVALPHHPYVLTPWGTVNSDGYRAAWVPTEPSQPGYEFITREVRAHQALQVGAVDGMVGHLVEHLKSMGAWEEATVVVMSDHGVDLTPPGGLSRRPNDDNMDELFRIPLFIKAPGQIEGEVRDDPASTADVLPSIVDLLGVETGWRFDGHSLFDGSEPKFDRRVTSDVEAAFEVAARQAAQFPARRGLGRPGRGGRGRGAGGAAGERVRGRRAQRPIPDAEPPRPARRPVRRLGLGASNVARGAARSRPHAAGAGGGAQRHARGGDRRVSARW